MKEEKKISPLVRIVSGVIGLLGFAAIAFNAAQKGGLEPDLVLVASFFAGFIFLYVSFFGRYPWDRSRNAESDD